MPQHGASYEALPALSERPLLIEYIEGHAEQSGFDFVDILGGLEPYAREELLYFRDDAHWNARGNELIAEILTEKLERFRPAVVATEPASSPERQRAPASAAR